MVRQPAPYYPDLPIIILTIYGKKQYIIKSIETGAMGYLSKNAVPEELVKAIERVMTDKKILN